MRVFSVMSFFEEIAPKNHAFLCYFCFNLYGDNMTSTMLRDIKGLTTMVYLPLDKNR